jgi:hypothetical protein
MSSVRPWPDVRPEDRWAIELMEERLAKTIQPPDELRGRASELRAQAEATEIRGVRDACLALADRYEETAARLAST